MPADAATSTCATVTPATALTSRWPTSRSGGTERSTGIITKAPPAPSSPATNAPANPRASSVTPKASVTRPAEAATAALRPREARWPLPDARPVCRQVGELLVGNRQHQRLYHLELGVARAPLVGLEEQHLVAEITRRLAGEIGDSLGRVSLARDAVAERALDGRGAAALDRRGVELGGRRGALLRAEVGGHVAHAELEHLLRVRLHLGRRPLARRIVLDRFLEVPRGHAREDRNGVRLALAGKAVASAAAECLGSGQAVERYGRGGAGEPEHEEQADKDDRYHVVLSRRPSRACLARCCWPTRPRSAPTSPTGRE